MSSLGLNQECFKIQNLFLNVSSLGVEYVLSFGVEYVSSLGLNMCQVWG